MEKSTPDPAFVAFVLDNNIVDKFHLLRGAPGICLEPAPWEKIRDAVRGNTFRSLATLGRHPSGIVDYRRFRNEVRALGDRQKAVIESRSHCQTLRYLGVSIATGLPDSPE